MFIIIKLLEGAILFAIIGFIVFFQIPANANVSQNFLNEAPPVYEAGMGAITLNLPDYPGSANNRIRVIPFPFAVYRGKYLRADDEGTRARINSNPNYETGLSFTFNFPVRSKNNPSRNGMDDLDSIFGLGPRFLYRFIPSSKHHRLNASVAARAVFSTNFGSRFKSEGFSIEPSLNYWYRWRKINTTLFSNLGFDFGSSKLTNFFYEVAPKYATNTRPTYKAKAGLIETSLSMGFGRTFYKEFFVFSGLSWRNLGLSSNKKSPLVETNNNVGFILGIVWTFYESESRVQPRPF